MARGLILIFPTLEARNAYICIEKETTGVAPTGIGNTAAAKRAYYPDALMRVIVNTSSSEMQMKLGRHRVATPLEVDNPTEAAKKAIEILKSRGFEATMNDEAEPEFEKGFMAFVSVPAFDGIILLFWAKNPNPKSMAKFRSSGEFRAWSDADMGS